MRCGAVRSGGVGTLGRLAPCKRRGGGEETGVSPHDDIDLHTARERVVEGVAHEREAT